MWCHRSGLSYSARTIPDTSELEAAGTENTLPFCVSEVRFELQENKTMGHVKAAWRGHGLWIRMRRHPQVPRKSTAETRASVLPSLPRPPASARLSPDGSQMVKKLPEYGPNKNNLHPFVTEKKLGDAGWERIMKPEMRAFQTLQGRGDRLISANTCHWPVLRTVC